MTENKPSDMVLCPFNNAHVIMWSRMDYHLTRCRKSYPDSKKVECPFDARHIVCEVELNYHMSMCPKRVMLDAMRYKADTELSTRPVAAPLQPPVVASEENWEEDAGCSYKPDQSKKAAHIITKPRGLKPSERRHARRQGINDYKPPTDC